MVFKPKIKVFPLIEVLTIVGIGLLVYNCTSEKKALQTWNMTNLYNPGSVTIHPEYIVFNTNDSTSLLLGKVYSNELLINQANPADKKLGKLRVNYQLVEITGTTENKAISDSATITYPVETTESGVAFGYSIKMKAYKGKKYKLAIITTDALRESSNRNYIFVDRTSAFNYQNYRIISHKTGLPLFERYVDSSDVFSVQFNQRGYTKIYVEYFKNEVTLPLPAFFPGSTPVRNDKPDSIWELPYTGSVQYKVKYRGMYYFQVDTTVKEGIGIHYFGDGFPKVLLTKSMIPPLEYLVNSLEFEAIKKAENKKMAVDNFWLKCAGNVEIARELIRVYYNRVFFANYYFTSDREGWKTDRGMIYIIYGLPNKINKTAIQESWTYYNNLGPSSIVFTFNKAQSPFTDNNYVLDRNAGTVTFWRQAVDTWRGGRVFNLEE